MPGCACTWQEIQLSRASMLELVTISSTQSGAPLSAWQRTTTRVTGHHAPAPGKKHLICVAPLAARYRHTTPAPTRFGSVTACIGSVDEAQNISVARAARIAHLLFGKVLLGRRRRAEHVLDRDAHRATGEAAARRGNDDRRRRVERRRADDPAVV